MTIVCTFWKLIHNEIITTTMEETFSKRLPLCLALNRDTCIPRLVHVLEVKLMNRQNEHFLRIGV